MDTDITDVIFRIDDKRGDLYAVFPNEPASLRAGEVQAYWRSGSWQKYMGPDGYTQVDYQLLLKETRLAKPEEYEPIKQMLEERGFNLRIRTRQNYETYIEAYRRLWKEVHV